MQHIFQSQVPPNSTDTLAYEGDENDVEEGRNNAVANEESPLLTTSGTGSTNPQTPTSYSYQERDEEAPPPFPTSLSSTDDNEEVEATNEGPNTNQNDTNNTTNTTNTTNPDFLTRTRQRLNVLFLCFTCPIIPLVLALLLNFFWMVYATISDDSCDQPLEVFSYMSTVLVLYSPNHKRVKKWIVQRFGRGGSLSVTRDGGDGQNANASSAAPTNNNNTTTTNNRRSSNNEYNDNSDEDTTPASNDPSLERIYDHLYFSLCLFYIYMGVQWTSNCRTQDLTNATNIYPCPSTSAAFTMNASSTTNTQSTNIFIRLFYWFTNSSVMDTSPVSSSTLLSSDDTDCQDIIIITCGCANLYHATKSFIILLLLLATVLLLPLLCLPCIYVWIVRGATRDAMEHQGRNGGTFTAWNDYDDDDDDDDDENDPRSRWSVDQVLDQMEQVYQNVSANVKSAVAASSSSIQSTSEYWLFGSSSSLSPSTKKQSLHAEDGIEESVEWKKNENTPFSYQRQMEFPKECCICMNEFSYCLPESKRIGPKSDIIRTSCGHVFHRDCLGGWLQGQWDDIADTADNDEQMENDDNVREAAIPYHVRRRRTTKIKASRRVCPLCRNDLVPKSPPPPSPTPSVSSSSSGPSPPPIS